VFYTFTSVVMVRGTGLIACPAVHRLYIRLFTWMVCFFNFLFHKHVCCVQIRQVPTKGSSNKWALPFYHCHERALMFSNLKKRAQLIIGFRYWKSLRYCSSGHQLMRYRQNYSSNVVLPFGGKELIKKMNQVNDMNHARFTRLVSS